MEKIKIAYIAKEMPINGISTVILNYCRNLDKDKFDITIFSGEPIDKYYIEECKKINVNIEKMPPKRGGNPLKYYNYLFKKITGKNFDIVHVHGNSATITIEMIMAFFRGIKIRIAHCHNTTCDKLRIHKVLKPIFKRIYTYGFACSEDAGKWLFGERDFKILPNGFDTQKFIFNLESRNRIRKELKLENKYIIGHVGMFNKQKNHEFLLEIFKDIAKENSDAYLLLVGNGPDYQIINEIIANHEFKERIICYGECSNVYDVYSAMDIFVLPSKHEGLGIVLLEAQINGLKCVASSVVPRESKISDNIKFLSLEDKNAWSKEILKKDEYDRNKNYAKNSEKIQYYDIRKNVEELANIYENLYNK